MRIGGLASGMDIDSIVKDMMKVKRMPLDKLKQKKQVLEWQRDDYRAINTMLLGFRDRLTQLKLTSNYRARTVASTDEAKVSATVTSGASQASYSISKVEQLATAAYRVSENAVSSATKKIDPAAGLVSQKEALGNLANWDPNTENPDTIWKTGVLETKTLSVGDFSEGQKKIQLNINGVTQETPLNVKVNGAGYRVVTDEGSLKPGTVYFNGTELIFHESESLTKGSSIKVDYAVKDKTVNETIAKDQKMISLGKGAIAPGLSFTVLNEDGSTKAAYAMGESINGFAELRGDGELLGKVHMATGVIEFEPSNQEELIPEGSKVSITFSQNYTDFTVGSHTSKGEVEERIFILGSDSLNTVIRKVNESSAGVTMFYDSQSDKITMTRKETGRFNKDELEKEITVKGEFASVFKLGAEEGGQNAKFTINGLSTERTSNTFSMNGVTFTLKQVFTDGTAVSLNVSNDTEGTLKNIKDFVDQYNTLISDINKKLNEERYRSYLPLTDEQRETLTDKQQEKWEEMAKSGLLKGDPMLSSVLSSMRLDLSGSVETNGLFRQLSAIGITTTANYLDGGKLEINEAKLKEALEKDPEAVENLFRGTGTADTDRGVIHKLYDTVNHSMTKIQNRAGRATSTNQQFALGRELLSIDKNINSFEDRLKMYEDRLWRQFTAMEKAIQQANNQAVYLMQQFGGGMY